MSRESEFDMSRGKKQKRRRRRRKRRKRKRRKRRRRRRRGGVRTQRRRICAVRCGGIVVMSYRSVSKGVSMCVISESLHLYKKSW